jgi:signal transduction histidine kinase
MEESLKILVIDDDEVDRMAVRRGLAKTGIKGEISEASDSATGIAILKQVKFDCIFLDYRLPDCDGVDVVKNIRDIGIKTPILVLTGKGDEQIAVEIMKAGASDYISKSRVSPETLERSLRSAIRIYRAETIAAQANQQLRESYELLKRQNQELEQQRQQIQLQNLQLQEAYRLKSQFLATMSHELRTPMNSIMGFSQLLLRQYPHPLTKQQLEIVQVIFNNSQNLLTMLNEILDFSQIEAGKFSLSCNEFDLGKLVILTTEELRSLATQKKITLTTEVDLTNPKVYNDSDSLRRVLINLLSNAIKFTDNGEVTVKVWEPTRDRVAIAVKDTGIGIEPENLKIIFEAFRQGDQSLTRKHSGTGLGLAITDSLVKIMQGEITVKSQPGKGSVFKIEIPRKIEKFSE